MEQNSLYLQILSFLLRRNVFPDNFDSDHVIQRKEWQQWNVSEIIVSTRIFPRLRKLQKDMQPPCIRTDQCAAFLRFAAYCMVFWTRLLGIQMKVEGVNYAEIHEPVILIINHQSLLDTGGKRYQILTDMLMWKNKIFSNLASGKETSHDLWKPCSDDEVLNNTEHSIWLCFIPLRCYICKPIKHIRIFL